MSEEQKNVDPFDVPSSDFVRSSTRVKLPRLLRATPPGAHPTDETLGRTLSEGELDSLDTSQTMESLPALPVPEDYSSSDYDSRVDQERLSAKSSLPRLPSM